MEEGIFGVNNVFEKTPLLCNTSSYLILYICTCTIIQNPEFRLNYWMDSVAAWQPMYAN